ncbi:MAG: glycosyltransferase family 2 protein [Ignavibacteriae bacterium]|nr:MAG: glycosyltransferase family 2 protein [Ignavibacteriota bacterium]
MLNNRLLNKKTGIVIVVTNEKHNLKMFFESLAEQSYKNFSLYFIDNNSSDSSVEFSKELNKSFCFDIKYTLLNENAGDAKGNSLGASRAVKDGCDYVFILNNDTELEPTCIEELIKLIEKDEKTGVTGPIFFYWTKEKIANKIQIYGAFVDFNTQKTNLIGATQMYEETELPEILKCDYPIGGALLIKREVIEKLGYLFDDRFFMYNNEIDFSRRVQALGYHSLATTKAKVWHNHKWVRDNKAGWYREYYLSERNKFLYYHKYKMYYHMLRMLIIDVIKYPWRLKWFIKVCNFKLGIWYLRGMTSGLLNIKGKPKISIIK